MSVECASESSLLPSMSTSQSRSAAPEHTAAKASLSTAIDAAATASGPPFRASVWRGLSSRSGLYRQQAWSARYTIIRATRMPLEGGPCRSAATMAGMTAGNLARNPSKPSSTLAALVLSLTEPLVRRNTAALATLQRASAFSSGAALYSPSSSFSRYS